MTDVTDGEVIRLRASGRKDDRLRRAAKQRRDSLPCILNSCTGATTDRMLARRIAEVLAQVREHRVNDFGQQRGSGVVIKIDRHERLSFPREIAAT
jgi:hypothetical protein